MSEYAVIIERIKKQKTFRIPIGIYNSVDVELRPLGIEDVYSEHLAKLLARWRDINSQWFPSQFKVTTKGTKKWLLNLVVDNPDRILFLIVDKHKKVYGHLGFYRYNARDNSCELDNVVRGVKKLPGLMTDVVNALTYWGFKNLKLDRLYLTVFADNDKAIKLYKRCGFVQISKVPLIKRIKKGETFWEETLKNTKTQVLRYNLKMTLDHANKTAFGNQ